MRPLTLTTPDRAIISQILASRSASGGEARALTDLLFGMHESETVEPRDVPASVVTLNSRVLVRMSGTSDEREFTLVVPGHDDIWKGRISVLTPVGSALLGRRVGDTVECDVPAGKVHFRIEALLYQPEAAGVEA